ncbi:hypothetical protein OWV82_011645, partial [Melia azedarach]
IKLPSDLESNIELGLVVLLLKTILPRLHFSANASREPLTKHPDGASSRSLLRHQHPRLGCSGFGFFARSRLWKHKAQVPQGQRQSLKRRLKQRVTIEDDGICSKVGCTFEVDLGIGIIVN